MKHAHFTTAFRGPLVENGEIDVNDLAPTLLALGDLIQATNKFVNESNVEMAVKVRAVSKGSFEIDLSLIQTLLEATKDMFDFARDSERVSDANGLLDLLFKVGSGVVGGAGGLFALKKFLGGKSPDKVETKGGDVHIYLNGNVFIANEKVHELSENTTIQRRMKETVAALTKEGMESICFKGNGLEALEVTRSEVEYFDYEDDADIIKDKISTETLQIINLSFDETNKWRVTDGDASFSVTIEDKEFLERVALNEISFTKDSILECSVRELQTRIGKRLKKERFILEVINFRSVTQTEKLL